MTNRSACRLIAALVLLAAPVAALAPLGGADAADVSTFTSSSDHVAADVSTSGAGAYVADYALAHVGDAYLEGGVGPHLFDAPGLAEIAWAQVGVYLPHSVRAQLGSGPQIDTSALQPGDLVFYYSSRSDVGIYVGAGRVVHADAEHGVRIERLDLVPAAGAVRPG